MLFIDSSAKYRPCPMNPNTALQRFNYLNQIESHSRFRFNFDTISTPLLNTVYFLLFLLHIYYSFICAFLLYIFMFIFYPSHTLQRTNPFLHSKGNNNSFCMIDSTPYSHTMYKSAKGCHLWCLQLFHKICPKTNRTMSADIRP